MNLQSHYAKYVSLQPESVELSDEHMIGGLKRKQSSAFVPMTLLVVPPGQPTVERHGPLFPALDTNITLCFCTASVITSQILLKETQISDGVPHKINPHKSNPTVATLTQN